ncbi:IS66-like element accessory protein TnpA [Rhodopseudomonas palustris]
MDTEDSAITKPVRRLEVFTGAGRRRTWSDEDKARVVAEIETSGDSVSGVARRHGLSPQQLFGWRRQVRESQTLASRDDEPRFVPAVVDPALSDTAAPRRRKTTRRDRDEPLAGMIEVAIDGVRDGAHRPRRPGRVASPRCCGH